MESRRRSVAKALSWRVFALMITTFTAWFVTGQLAFAAEIGLIDSLLKIGAYYFHERSWINISFGRPEPPEYEI